MISNPRKEDECCKNCLFFKREALYKCRFNAPMINKTEDPYWPYVHIDDWCGEFIQRKEEKSE